MTLAAILILLAFAAVIGLLFGKAYEEIRRRQALEDWQRHPPDSEVKFDDEDPGE